MHVCYYNKNNSSSYVLATAQPLTMQQIYGVWERKPVRQPSYLKFQSQQEILSRSLCLRQPHISTPLVHQFKIKGGIFKIYTNTCGHLRKNWTFSCLILISLNTEKDSTMLCSTLFCSTLLCFCLAKLHVRICRWRQWQQVADRRLLLDVRPSCCYRFDHSCLQEHAGGGVSAAGCLQGL